MPFCQKSANRKKFVALRHPDTSENEQLFCREMEVEARPCGLVEILQVEGRRDVGLIRTLVLGETRIPIDAEHSLLHWRHIPRREFRKLCIDRVHQCFERSTNLLLVDVLAWLEPFALIVALEPAEERDG